MAPRSARILSAGSREKVVGEMTEWLNRPLEKGRFPVIVANQLETRWVSIVTSIGLVCGPGGMLVAGR
jgi:hypothetical protein